MLRPVTIIVAIILSTYTLVVCSDPHSLVLAQSSDSTENKVPTAPLPPEFRTLARILSHETATDFQHLRDDQGANDSSTTDQSLVRLHRSLMDLHDIKSSDPDITYIAQLGDAAGSDLVDHLERLIALPHPPSQSNLLLRSFLGGFTGDLRDPATGVQELLNTNKALADELDAIAAAYRRVDVASQLIPKIAEHYSGSLVDSTERLSVDFYESWGCFSPDSLCVYNAGPEAKDCTVVVKLTGANGETRTNVHFVGTWPSCSSMCAKYQAGEDINGKSFRRETVNKVQHVDVAIYSPEFKTSIHYVYQGTNKDKWISKVCKKLRLTASYQPFKKGVIWNTARSTSLALKDMPLLGKCNVEVEFCRGDEAKTWRWEFDSWKEDEIKVVEPPENGLTFDPEVIDVLLTFPGTDYTYRQVFPVIPRTEVGAD